MNHEILIFDYQTSGHHLEYLHHLYEMALTRKNVLFVFAVPNDFRDKSNLLVWKEQNNIEFYFFDNKKVMNAKNIFHRSYLSSKYLKEVISIYKPSQVFLIAIMGFMPFLPFVVRNTKISGIIYKIYLYRWRDSSIFQRFQDIIKYVCFSSFPIFKSIYTLNDAGSALFLNRQYNTNCFEYLDDPFVPLSNDKIENKRQELNISETKTIFFHFGAMNAVKGTLEILQAIPYLDHETKQNTVLIFAGKISNSISYEFYRLVEMYKKEIRIIVFDEFCSYELLGSLCQSSDSILVPYKRVENSSGAIGYGAQFRKPVIATGRGLLGKLVRKNNLGVLIPDVSGQSIAIAMMNIKQWSFKTDRYIQRNTVANFQKKIMNDLLKKT